VQSVSYGVTINAFWCGLAGTIFAPSTALHAVIFVGNLEQVDYVTNRRREIDERFVYEANYQGEPVMSFDMKTRWIVTIHDNQYSGPAS
jgi:nitrous oxidase accessory protein NosD